MKGRTNTLVILLKAKCDSEEAGIGSLIFLMIFFVYKFDGCWSTSEGMV